jgi:hypothetical protein
MHLLLNSEMETVVIAEVWTRSLNLVKKGKCQTSVGFTGDMASGASCVCCKYTWSLLRTIPLTTLIVNSSHDSSSLILTDICKSRGKIENLKAAVRVG